MYIYIFIYIVESTNAPFLTEHNYASFICLCGTTQLHDGTI